MPKSIKETRLGCLWAILLPFVYTFVFIVVLLLLPHEPFPENLVWYEYIGVILKYGVSGFLYLIIYFVLLIPIMIFSIIMGLSDPSIGKTLKASWPFLLAILYIILPDFLPGPVDDLVITLIASGLGAMLISKQLKKRREEKAKRDTLEVEILPKEETDAAMEKPKEIIDVEFEEKS